MASVLYAWEFGAALGHIGTFLPIATTLRQHGHTVNWVVTHPHQAARLLHQAGFDWMQAPMRPEQRRDGPPLNYGDILLRFGYADSDDLLGLVVAWRTLLQLPGTPRPDAADALACAICHAHSGHGLGAMIGAGRTTAMAIGRRRKSGRMV